MNTNRTTEAIKDSLRCLLRITILRFTVLCIWLLALRAAATTYYVDINSTNPTPPYTNWSIAATNIQDAVDAAAAGDTVLVTDGVYQAGGQVVYGISLNRVAIMKPITVESVNGPAATTIRGYYYPYPANGVRCVYLTNDALLAGFTLTQGDIDAINGGSSDVYDIHGGGVYAEADGIVSNCVISGNVVYGSSGTNNAEGGGMYGGAAVDCTISGNHTIVLYNTTVYGGGASFSSLTNCVISENSSTIGGGAHACALDNCTVTDNSAQDGGGVADCAANNSIVYFNTSEATNGCPNYIGTTFSYSCITPDPGGTANITNDPDFVNSANGDYNLQLGSPCINAGNNAYVGTATDLNGNPRIVAGIVDMGAYEYQAMTIAITAQPATQTNILAETTTLSVDALSVYPLTYQWFFDSNSISGATNSNLVISNLQLTNAGAYFVVISNPLITTDSAPAILSVFYPPPAILQEPTNLTVILGSNAMLSVTATSYLNMTFQWQLNGTNLNDEGEFSGSTNSNLFISGANVADAGNYDVIISDSEWSVTSAVTTLSIVIPATITLQPTNQTAVVPNDVSLFAAASGTGPLGYQWFFNGTPLSDVGNITGSTSPNLNISGVQLANAGFYQLLVTNSLTYATSVVATLTVLAPPEITQEPTNEAVLIGDTADLSVTATGTALDYQWYFNGELLSDGGRISGSSTANLTIANLQSSDGGDYQVVVSNAVNTVASTIATLTPLENPGPSIRYVNISNSTPASPYLSWSTAATNIQNAIDASINGDSIIVTDGVYQAEGEIVAGSSLSNRVVINKSVTVQSVNGPGSTVILGNPPTYVGIYPNYAGVVRCVYMTNNSSLVGFTLANGGTLGYANGNDEDGAGVWCTSTNNVVISNCVIAANIAFNQGGGVYQGILANCTVLGNQAIEGGGVANALIVRSMVVSNVAKTVNGYGQGEGGGVYNSSVFSSALAENSAAYEGGGACGGTLINSTVTANTASQAGGGIESGFQTNCIIYYNQILSNESWATNSDTTVALDHCCTTPMNYGPGNITNAPVLATISHISLNSPCRGAGNPLVTVGVDIDGNPWANPPSIGCSEIPPGGDFGNLIVNISTQYTNWAPGYPLNFQATLSGPCYTTVWNFGDGTILTNVPYLSHVWSSVGNYPVTLTAYNDSYPTGVTTTLMINIAVPTNYYVNWANPNPVPPYSYWSTAATNIQDAVRVANPGSLVLVTNPAVIVWKGEETFVTNSVAVYQYGGATAPDHSLYCVVVTNAITVESVNGPATTFILGSANCVYLTNGATLSGFTATNVSIYSSSGQISAVSTNAILTNCILTHYVTVHSGTLDDCALSQSSYSVNSTLNNCTVSNTSWVLGGILNNCMLINNATSPATAGQSYPLVLNNCLISNNTSQYGGGVYNSFYRAQNYTNCILNNCILTRNSAQHNGGGAYVAELNNCLISSNTATFFGGGVEGGLLNNCVLVGNSAGDNGGGADNYLAPFTLNNCTLAGNVAASGGGANGFASGSFLNQCIVSNNVSGFGGGVVGCALTNCLLVYNVATNGGGAADSILVNCTVAYNSSKTGGGIFDGSAVNCILYYNVGGDYGTANTPTRYNINFCCTAVLPSTAAGNLETTVGNITNAPLFVNPAGGDYHLQSSSPCINSGNNAYVSSATDLDGNPRIAGGTVDIGAYEYQTPTSVISYAYLQQYGLPTDGSVDFADLDGTAFNVYQDWIAGLNPTNPASVLAMLTPVTTTNPTGVTVTWQSVSGIPYLLQRSTNLTSQPPFSTIQNNITGQSGTTSYTDTSATNNVPYFYRVGVVAP